MFVNYIKSRCKPRPRHTYIQNLPLKQNKKNKLLKELTFLGLKLAKTENKSCTQKKLNLNLQQHYFGPKSNLRLCFLNVTGNSVHAVYVPVTSKFIQIVLQYNGPYKLVFFFFFSSQLLIFETLLERLPSLPCTGPDFGVTLSTIKTETAWLH